jgi:hypothetical protein
MIFQNAMPIFLSRGTILNYKQEDFVLEKKVFATLVNYTQQYSLFEKWDKRMEW